MTWAAVAIFLGLFFLSLTVPSLKTAASFRSSSISLIDLAYQEHAGMEISCGLCGGCLKPDAPPSMVHSCDSTFPQECRWPLVDIAKESCNSWDVCGGFEERGGWFYARGVLMEGVDGVEACRQPAATASTTAYIKVV